MAFVQYLYAFASFISALSMASLSCRTASSGNVDKKLCRLFGNHQWEYCFLSGHVMRILSLSWWHQIHGGKAVDSKVCCEGSSLCSHWQGSRRSWKVLKFIFWFFRLWKNPELGLRCWKSHEILEYGPEKASQWWSNFLWRNVHLLVAVTAAKSTVTTSSLFQFFKNTNFCFLPYLLGKWWDLHKNFSKCSWVNLDFSCVTVIELVNN